MPARYCSARPTSGCWALGGRSVAAAGASSEGGSGHTGWAGTTATSFTCLREMRCGGYFTWLIQSVLCRRRRLTTLGRRRRRVNSTLN